jgi:hypothetical protein
VEPLLADLERLSHQTPEQIASEVLTRRPAADGSRSLSSAPSLEAQVKQPRSAPVGAEAEPQLL